MVRTQWLWSKFGFIFSLAFYRLDQLVWASLKVPGFPKLTSVAFLSRWWHTWCKFTNYKTQRQTRIGSREALGLNLKCSGTKDKIMFDLWITLQNPFFLFALLFFFPNHKIEQIRCKLNIFHVSAFFPSYFSMLFLIFSCRENIRVWGLMAYTLESEKKNQVKSSYYEFLNLNFPCLINTNSRIQLIGLLQY